MEEKKVFEYEIGGKKYTQGALVLGQLEQLLPIAEGVTVQGDSEALEVIRLLGDKISTAIAIVLRADKEHLKDKNVEELAETLKFEMEMDVAFKVVEDFFLCNPIASLLDKLADMMDNVTESLEMDGSENLSQSSQKETSPSESKSSGDTTSKSASHS
jgi:hypothetical protein